jgi:hypothetical protein
MVLRVILSKSDEELGSIQYNCGASLQFLKPVLKNSCNHNISLTVKDIAGQP